MCRQRVHDPELTWRILQMAILGSCLAVILNSTSITQEDVICNFHEGVGPEPTWTSSKRDMICPRTLEACLHKDHCAPLHVMFDVIGQFPFLTARILQVGGSHTSSSVSRSLLHYYWTAKCRCQYQRSGTTED